ncbi:hypothetical protein [Bacteroides pyogenes]|uniref:hypothetical protein n=1 Tax=Bacteroides pyogenes TaxID=310300 RepID=UPI002FD9D499
MVSIKTLYYGIARAVKGICDKGYYQDRPSSVADRPGSYIVINFPSAIYNNEISEDGRYSDFETTVLIEIYIRDKMKAENPVEMDLVTMDDKVSKVMALFPISTKDFVLKSPRVTFQASDGSGFHVTIIQGRLRTK